MLTDKQLLERICGILGPLEYTLSEQDLYGGVRDSMFDELFQYFCSDDPLNEFVDEGLERERQKLQDSVCDFRKYFVYHVSLSGNWYYPSIHFCPRDREDTVRGAELMEEVKILNEKATAVWNAYKTFVRNVRKGCNVSFSEA